MKPAGPITARNGESLLEKAVRPALTLEYAVTRGFMVYFWMESIILNMLGVSIESVRAVGRISAQMPLETGGLDRLSVIESPTLRENSGDCRLFLARANQRRNTGEDG